LILLDSIFTSFLQLFIKTNHILFFLQDWYVHPVHFLDCDLVDFANQLPAGHKLLALDEKHLIKIVDKVRGGVGIWQK